MFKDNLISLRKVNHLSQEQLAEQLGISRQTLSKYETGESVPDIEKSKQIADFFGVSLDDLVNFSVEEYGLNVPPVYSDRIEHSARRFRADLPPFQSNLSALLSTPFRKSSAYLSGYECNDRFSIPLESLFRAL